MVPCRFRRFRSPFNLSRPRPLSSCFRIGMESLGRRCGLDSFAHACFLGCLAQLPEHSGHGRFRLSCNRVPRQGLGRRFGSHSVGARFGIVPVSSARVLRMRHRRRSDRAPVRRLAPPRKAPVPESVDGPCVLLVRCGNVSGFAVVGRSQGENGRPLGRGRTLATHRFFSLFHTAAFCQLVLALRSFHRDGKLPMGRRVAGRVDRMRRAVFCGLGICPVLLEKAAGSLLLHPICRFRIRSREQLSRIRKRTLRGLLPVACFRRACRRVRGSGLGTLVRSGRFPDSGGCGSHRFGRDSGRVRSRSRPLGGSLGPCRRCLRRIHEKLSSVRLGQNRRFAPFAG